MRHTGHEGKRAGSFVGLLSGVTFIPAGNDVVERIHVDDYLTVAVTAGCDLAAAYPGAKRGAWDAECYRCA
jgi:hypothetical protein